MLNHIIIMGRLTRDPELRRTGSGIAVASFSVAVERDYPSKDTGEREVDFIDCVAWRQTGEFVSRYFTKGSMIVVSGRLQIRNWIDKDGNKRRTAEIVADDIYFGESKKSNGDSGSVGSVGTSPYANVPYYSPTPTCGDNYSSRTPWPPRFNSGVKPAVSDFAMLDDDDAQLPF